MTLNDTGIVLKNGKFTNTKIDKAETVHLKIVRSYLLYCKSSLTLFPLDFVT